MDDADVQTRKWTRLEYDRLVEAEFFGPGDRIELLGGHLVVKEPQYSPHAAMISRVQRALATVFGDGVPDRRLEIYRDPVPDTAARFGWRYALTFALDRGPAVTPLARPATSIAVGDLLPPVRTR